MHSNKTSQSEKEEAYSLVTSVESPESNISAYVDANINKFISTILRSMHIDVGDINCISCVIRGIVLTIPDIMKKYIILKKKFSGKTYIKDSLPTYFKFTVEEMGIIKNAIMAELIGIVHEASEERENKMGEIWLKSKRLYEHEQIETTTTMNEVEKKETSKKQLGYGILDKKIFNLFLEEKIGPLCKFIEYTFSQGMRLKEYIIDSNRNSKIVFTHEKRFLAYYVFKSEQFRSALKSLCLSILTPSIPVTRLINLLKPKHFDMGIEESEDFSRETLEMLTDTMNKFTNLQVDITESVAAKLFEKHKYLYLCDYIENMSFDGVIQPLCLALGGYVQRVSYVINSFDMMFTYIEIAVIKKYLNRLELGLLNLLQDNPKKNTDQEVTTKRYLEQEGPEVLLDKIKTRLKVDLRECERRQHKMKVMKSSIGSENSTKEPTKVIVDSPPKKLTSSPGDGVEFRGDRGLIRRKNVPPRLIFSGSTSDIHETIKDVQQSGLSRSPHSKSPRNQSNSKSPRKSPRKEIKLEQLSLLHTLDIDVPTDLEVNATTSINTVGTRSPIVKKMDEKQIEGIIKETPVREPGSFFDK